MTFQEKLERLCEDRFKNRVSVRAGLTPTAISTYIAKGYMPRADTALRLARTLGVSLEWLIDETQAWPPVRVDDRVDAAVA